MTGGAVFRCGGMSCASATRAPNTTAMPSVPPRARRRWTYPLRHTSRSRAPIRDQASVGTAAHGTKDLLEAGLRRADRGSLREGRTRLADYVVFGGAAAPDPRTAATAVVADGLCQIIEVEGLLLAKRAYDLYLRGCGIRRLGGEIRTALNRGLAKAIRDGRVISERAGRNRADLFDGSTAECRPAKAPCQRLRFRGNTAS